MSIELKIKAKHLAVEPHIIRREERRLLQRIRKHRSTDSQSAFQLQQKFESLSNHRKHLVRTEARATHLARAFLADKPYTSCEHKRLDDFYFTQYVLPRLHAMITKYGSREQRKLTREQVLAWATAPIV